ncbi:MAG TPA: hypothetical protein VEQ60_21220 [Longimicrobium sp.]|nr:hypothetical protein [Longimicrobium sp.]
MTADDEDRLEHSLVAYSVEYAGRTVMIESVPARIDEVTGERFYSPKAVEQIQAIVWTVHAGV